MSEKDLTPEERQVLLLEDLVRWTKVANYEKVKAILEEVLDRDNKRTAYILTAQGLNRDEICKKAKINKTTLTVLWKQCETMGLAVRESGKIKPLFDLEDFGLVP